MGKVDWTLAELLYITNDDVSYSDIAKHYNVAKSTVVRHAAKTEWPAKRRDYAERRIATLEKKTMQTRVDAEERQLKTLRVAQAVFNNEILRLGDKQTRGLDISRKEVRNITQLTHAITKAIMAERTILGLSTKLLQIRDEDAIHEYKVLMGLEEETPAEQVKGLKDDLQMLDRMIERRRMIQGMIDRYEEDGIA